MGHQTETMPVSHLECIFSLSYNVPYDIVHSGRHCTQPVGFLPTHIFALEKGGFGDSCLYDKVVEDKNSDGAIEGVTPLCRGRLAIDASE